LIYLVLFFDQGTA